MQEILDIEFANHTARSSNGNLKKAKVVLLFIISFIGFSILMIALFNSDRNNEIKDILIGLPIIISMLMTPIGLFFILKSYYKKEIAKGKILCLLTYLLVSLIFTAMLYSFIHDIYKYVL